jgi:chloramphenicol 3-O phosphotransferase
MIKTLRTCILGNVILLNGCSSAGKTTLARELQHILDQPYQHISLDQFRDGMPPRVRGFNSPDSDPGSTGLNVIPRKIGRNRLSDIKFGDYGKTILMAMRRAAAELSQMDCSVIVDDIIFEKEFLDDYAAVMNPESTWIVEVTCDLEIIKSRESQRPGRFPGTAESHYFSIHRHGINYDVSVDTGQQSPKEAAGSIVNAMNNPPTGLKRYLAN